MASVDHSADALRRALRTIPDFPKPGIQFQDITPLLADPNLLARAADVLAAPFADSGITQVVGIESRGFILAPLIARQLDAGFVPVRKEGKLPHDTIATSYELEYGTDTVEVHADALDADDCVLIHDDVIATGGTAAATAHLVAQTDAALAGFSFLIALTDLNGRDALPADAPVHTVLPVAGA
ncbi:adenine phosphoribosyltransferase [Longimonas halophila]|uniref:Adenine phosphoribosyltransferase n=1 Tax=Longimonas halophila TaxID=1469170 RepID=A0A2H3NQ66_9BACT|nr:adenine phosphoribosyltransferase [Longimonas halophila]PEN09411.1 adenine phosphoribosyltransferase [Longimonas halophila]